MVKDKGITEYAHEYFIAGHEAEMKETSEIKFRKNKNDLFLFKHISLLISY